MSRSPRKKPGKSHGASGGFSMRFTAHADSNEDSDDMLGTDGSRASSMLDFQRVAPPPRPSKAPTRSSQSGSSAPAARELTSAGQTPADAPNGSGGEETGGGAAAAAVPAPAVVDDDFLLLDMAKVQDDHFMSTPPPARAQEPHSGSSKKTSFYSSPKSEQANSLHDLSLLRQRPQPAAAATTSGDEAPWRRERRPQALAHAAPASSSAAVDTFGSGVGGWHLFAVATAIMLFWQFNTSAFLTGSAVGAYAMLHFGLLLVYQVTKEVPHGDGFIIDFEELHAAMVAHQAVTTGDGISLMQPKTILKECFGVTKHYSGPTTLDPKSVVKKHLRLCGSQLKISTVGGAADIPLLELANCIPDSCSDSSSSDNDSDLEDAAFRSRAASPHHQKATLLSSKSYSLLGCKIRLAPDGLNQRQRWGKKLPLHLIIDSDAQFSSTEDIPSKVEESAGPYHSTLLSPPKARRTTAPPTTEFFLFAPTGRAKQDWYMRLKLASEPERVSKYLASVPAEHSIYPKYMDFLLIHLHPHRAIRYNFLRNDAMFTSNQLREMASSSSAPVSTTTSADSSLAGVSSAAMGSATASLPSANSADRHQVAGSAGRPGLSRSSSAMSNMSNMSSTSSASQRSLHYHQQQTQQRSGITHDPRLSLRSGSLLWFNAALGRLFYDAWREPRWAEKLRVRWQRKLSRMKTPSYIRQLNMTELHLGDSIPLVRKFSQPRVDSRGLWIDVGISYKGNFQVTIETAMNLSPLLDEQTHSSSSPPPSASSGSGAPSTHAPLSTRMSSHKNEDLASLTSVTMASIQGRELHDEDDLSTDSDMDSGADEDDELHEASGPSASATALATATSMLQSLEKTFPSLSSTFTQVTGLSSGGDTADASSSSSSAAASGGSAGSQALTPASSVTAAGPAPPQSTSKLKRFAGFVAHTRIGQSVMKSNVVKRLSEKVANMPLVLTVELKAMYGTMTVNFPPPPSGVIWISFASAPHITLVAKPRVGQHEVKVNQVTDWIERKLISEFTKRLVMPNMEDIAIPLLSSGMEDDVAEVTAATAAATAGETGCPAASEARTKSPAAAAMPNST